MNEYLSFLGYQGPKTLLILILIMFYWQGITNPYTYGAILLWKIVNYIFNISIKNILKAPRPDSYKNPHFTELKPTFKNFLFIHKNFGMPSGHAQDVVGEVILITLLFQKPWLTAIAGAQAALTLWQRYQTYRHSLKQLFAGSLMGIWVALIYYYIFNQYNIFNQYLHTQPQPPHPLAE